LDLNVRIDLSLTLLTMMLLLPTAKTVALFLQHFASWQELFLEI
jgi:hypothetical protein